MKTNATRPTRPRTMETGKKTTETGKTPDDAPEDTNATVPADESIETADDGTGKKKGRKKKTEEGEGV